jgi:hypothetical protein
MENIAFKALIVTKTADRQLIRAITSKHITYLLAREPCSTFHYSSLNSYPLRKKRGRVIVAISD